MRLKFCLKQTLTLILTVFFVVQTLPFIVFAASNTVDGVKLYLEANGGWTGANIILGTDANQWPFSTGDTFAFTPEKNTTYRLTFNVTSTGAAGFRVRWIGADDYGSYTDGDTAVVNNYPYTADEVAVNVPAYFQDTIENSQTKTYTVDFTMDGSEVAGGLIGNLGIRGQGGNNSFILNWIKIETMNGSVLANWDKDAPPPDGSVAGLHWDQYPALKDVYKDYFLLGAMDSPSNSMIADRKALIDYNYNSLTPGNAMKPESVQPTQGVFTFDLLDEIFGNLVPGTAKIGHTLGWHQQTPDWMWGGSTYNITREQALANIKSLTDAVFQRYGADLHSMDVVNEAMGNVSNPSDWKNMLNKSGWYGTPLGSDWVEEFFKASADIADANGWNVKLYYNDFGLDGANKAQAVYNMVKEINEKYADYRPNGKPLIEGIGMQCHYNAQTIPANVEASIKLFGSLPGISISISELDIAYATTDGTMTEAQQKSQAQKYAELFQIFKKYATGPANTNTANKFIERVTIGSVTDRNDGGWLSGQAPAMFDMQRNGKEALLAVLDPSKYLEGIEAGPQTEFPRDKAIYGSPVLGINDPIWNTTTSFMVDTKPVKEPNGMGSNSVATAEIKAMWDEQYLYIRALVKDSLLTYNSTQTHEKDSVEIFVSENANRGTAYSDNDNQYRVAYDGTKSIKIGSNDAFESYAEVISGGYLVELKIPFKDITPNNGTNIGFDVQINDVDGTTRKLTVWSDLTANGYNTPQYWGTLNLVKTVGGINVYAQINGDSWSGANIILGNDDSKWPWSTAGSDGAVALTPKEDTTYRLTFSATSTGTPGYRVRWIKDNENGSYTLADAAVVNNYVYTADQVAIMVPAYFQDSTANGETKTYTVDFTMDGSEVSDGLIGNLAIRGQGGSNAFYINWIQIETLDGKVVARWPEGITPEPPAPAPTTTTPIFASSNVPATMISDPYVYIEGSGSASNTTSAPSTPATGCGLSNAVINAKNITIKAGDRFNIMNGVTAKDDGGKGADLTKKITVRGTINTHKVGKYNLTYSVTGCNGNKVSKTITVTVK